MEEVKPKVGGYLYCHTPLAMKNGEDQGKMAVVKGRHYKIKNIYMSIMYIKDELGNKHGFPIKDFNEWFIYSDKVLRNIKKSVDSIIDNNEFWD